MSEHPRWLVFCYGLLYGCVLTIAAGGLVAVWIDDQRYRCDLCGKHVYAFENDHMVYDHGWERDECGRVHPPFPKRATP